MQFISQHHDLLNIKIKSQEIGSIKYNSSHFEVIPHDMKLNRFTLMLSNVSLNVSFVFQITSPNGVLEQ